MKKSVGRVSLEKGILIFFASPWGEFWDGLWGDSMDCCGNEFYCVFYSIIMQNIEVLNSLSILLKLKLSFLG
jgi:hypothetical protein